MRSVIVVAKCNQQVVYLDSFPAQVEEVKPLTNQKESGRCWLFACLNAMRIPFVKALQVWTGYSLAVLCFKV